MYICMYTYTNISIYIYKYVHRYAYICIYIYIYILISIYYFIESSILCVGFTVHSVEYEGVVDPRFWSDT